MFFEPFGSSEVSSEDIVPGLYIEIMVSAVFMESGRMFVDMEEKGLAKLLTDLVISIFGDKIEVSSVASILTAERIYTYIEHHTEYLSEYIRQNRGKIEREELVVSPTDTLRHYGELRRFHNILGELDLFRS